MKLHISKRFLSLRFKIVASFLLIIFFSSSVIGLYSYYSARANIEKAVGGSALSIVSSIVDTIDGDKFTELKSKEDMQTSYYKELYTHLADIRKQTGLKFLFTMAKTDSGKYIYVVDGTPMDDKDFSSLGDEEDEMSDAQQNCFKGEIGYELDSDKWGDFISAYIPIKDKSGKVVGILCADFDASSMVKQLQIFKMNILIIIVMVIILAFIISEVLSYVLLRSLKKLKIQAEKIKDGDLTIKFQKVSQDEVGTLTQAFIEMVNNLLGIIGEIKNNTKNVAAEIKSLHESFGETSRATEEISQVINEIASGTVEQANSVQEVSNSMDEVFSKVKKSVNHANLVSDLSKHAAMNATQAMDIFKTSIEKVVNVNETVEHTAKIILELGDKSKEISNFSETISRITKQTNLLSLNASIEAARAGEQGKGFAVVADQIKVLAEQSSEASRQISQIATSMQSEIDYAIQSIQEGVSKAKDGVSTVTQVDTYLVDLQKSNNDSYLKVKEIINAIISIEEECKRTVVKVNELADISRNFSAGSQQAAASSEEQTAMIHQIKDNINNVKDMTNYLNNITNKFKIE